MNSEERDTIWQQYHLVTQAFNYARSHNDSQYAMFRSGQIREPHFINLDTAKTRIERSEWESPKIDTNMLTAMLGDQTV